MGISAAVVGEVALDTGAVAAADATAAGLGFSSAAEAIGAGAVDAATLGLPEATTVADLGAVEGSASAGFVSSGAAPGVAGGVAAGQETLAATTAPTDFASYMQQQAAANANIYDPTAGANIGDIVNPEASPVQAPVGGGIGGNTYGGNTLSDLLGYAKTGAQVIGGAGQLAGGIAQMQRSGQLQGRADPMGVYRPGYASQLNQLIQDPSTITTTPGYQFNLANYMQQLQANQAKQGNLVSGGAAIQSGQMGQQYATSSLQQQQSLLAQLAGANQSPAYGQQTVSQVGGTGLQAATAGLGNVIDPLATLYSRYNTGSPTA